MIGNLTWPKVAPGPPPDLVEAYRVCEKVGHDWKREPGARECRRCLLIERKCNGVTLKFHRPAWARGK